LPTRPHPIRNIAISRNTSERSSGLATPDALPIDSPPVLPFSDARLLLSSLSEDVLLIGRSEPVLQIVLNAAGYEGFDYGDYNYKYRTQDGPA
jgi:hypothetical protein